MNTAHQQTHIIRLRGIFEDILESVNETSWEQLIHDIQWVEIRGGETLFREGDPGDNFYIVLSGRLQAQVQATDGSVRRLSIIGRSEFIGEMSLLTNESRTATVVALRDSLLAAAPKSVFDKIFEMFPGIVRHIARNMVTRLKNANSGVSGTPHAYASVAILPISPATDARAFADALATVLHVQNRAVVLDSRACYSVLGSREKYSVSEWQNKILLWLNEKEADADLLLYVADPQDADWTARCLRQADLVLLLADAEGNPALSQTEIRFVQDTDPINRFLVLMHTAGTPRPSHTENWIKPRRLDRHIHLRAGNRADMERLGRFLTDNANGFVLAGGAARGMAHLGIYRALLEHGIQIDLFGGTSVGALAAGIVALHHPNPDAVMDTARRMVAANPTKRDFDFLPIISLLSGRRLRNALHIGFGEHRIEDLWYDFRCVSSNMSQSREAIHQTGSLERAVRASCSLPGIFPPVVFGNDLHVDGGTMNNLPIDVLREAGARRIIAADLDTERSYDVDYPDMLRPAQLLFDRFFWKKRNRAPSTLDTIMKSSVLGSDEKARRLAETADLFFKPDVRNVGYLAWDALESTERLGYDYARRVLETVDPADWR